MNQDQVILVAAQEPKSGIIQILEMTPAWFRQNFSEGLLQPSFAVAWQRFAASNKCPVFTALEISELLLQIRGSKALESQPDLKRKFIEAAQAKADSIEFNLRR